MYEDLLNEERENAKKSKERNADLQEKKSKLQEEVEKLSCQIISNQMDRAHNHEALTVLKKELVKQKLDMEKNKHELDFCNSNIDLINRTLGETFNDETPVRSDKKYIKEFLDLKDQMITCLRDELYDVRLKQAENVETIKDLERTLIDLEIEVDSMKKITPETISNLQGEIFSTNYRMAEIYAKFKAIKRDTEDIKINWRYCLEDHVEDREKNSDFKISKWSPFNKDSKEIKELLKEKKSDVKEMEREIAFLNEKLQELDSQNQQLTKNLKMNKTQIIMHNITIDDMQMKGLSTDRDAIYYENKRYLLELDTKEKIKKIETSCREKDIIIEKLRKKLENLQNDVDVKTEKKLGTKVVEEKLENQVVILEKRLKELLQETNGFT